MPYTLNTASSSTFAVVKNSLALFSENFSARMKREGSPSVSRQTKKLKLANVTYCTLLRGINVSGQKSIKMVELREVLCTQLPKLQNLRTYIQTGNVVYEAPLSEKYDAHYWSNKIEAVLLSSFGYSISAVTRSRSELEELWKANPFTDKESKRVFITFLGKKPEEEKVAALAKDFGTPDEYCLLEKDIFVHCACGYTKSKLSNNGFEKLLGVSATTRNYNTLKKLLTL
jgi:uncharacterized protein (DUF1697 family)